MPVIVPTLPPQEEVFICLPTTPVGAPISSMSKGTSSNPTEATTSRGN